MNYPAATVRDLTVQEIQLELIRRTRFNAMDGERVYASLLAHRHLWVAALLDRPGFANYEEPGDLLGMGLIRLRDLPANIWNADTLYLLTKSRDQAIELARLIEAQDWAGEVAGTRGRAGTQPSPGLVLQRPGARVGLVGLTTQGRRRRCGRAGRGGRPKPGMMSGHVHRKPISRHGPVA